MSQSTGVRFGCCVLLLLMDTKWTWCRCVTNWVLSATRVSVHCIHELMAWYDGVYLKGRGFTVHERQAFERYAGVSLLQTDNGTTISEKRTLVKRPINLKVTHYHHMNALLAFMSCYTDPGVEPLIRYDEREIVAMPTAWHGLSTGVNYSSNGPFAPLGSKRYSWVHRGDSYQERQVEKKTITQ